ncbi:MAG: leucyl aminopeptidase [Candidatus Riflebacteria bacterium]|nr:leucyl aminopeptidase [Candidatus Riflebacteria bacterium]
MTTLKIEICTWSKAVTPEGWILLPVRPSEQKPVEPLSEDVCLQLNIPDTDWASEGDSCHTDSDGIVIFKAAPILYKDGVGSYSTLNSAGDALGRGLKALSTRKVRHAAILMPEMASAKTALASLLLGIPDLAAFDVSPFKTHETEKKMVKIPEITFVTMKGRDSAALRALLHRIRLMSEGVNFARRLVDVPANWLGPAELAAEARTLESDGIRFSLLGKRDLEKMGGLAAVGSGSKKEPCFIILELNPGKKSPLVLIGKGVTFDSGGLSLKTSHGMIDMKNDMGGAAAVIAAIRTLARLGCRKRVIGLVPAVENMPDGGAMRPSDVVRMYDGQTVEISNTDAEGRLIVADALAYAATLHPEWTVDIATLTGAVVTALGPMFTGLFTDDKGLEQAICRASERSGERVWGLPLHVWFRDEMKSLFADWKNRAGTEGAASLAAAFLQAFAKGRWAHLDIAGSVWTDKDRSYFPKGPSGVGVKLLVELVEGAGFHQ